MGNRGFGSWKQGGASENRKVRGAVKVIMEGGIKADSKLEAYMHERLRGLGIEFEFHRWFELQEGFEWRESKIRAIRWCVDFYFPWCDVVVDTKGFITEKADLKMKLFKYRYRRTMVLLPSNRDGVDREVLYLLGLWTQHQNIIKNG